ncbi:hypothetical protein, partial [Shewanella algae]|uniref:hypothetical protein n=1 Tax=Shewanella algae TaxID=38313 RepID=UPI00313C597B
YLGATKDAMARYFILYMQENQQLQLFYQLLQGREQNLYNPSAYIRTNNLLLQDKGLSSMDKLYNDFDIWILKQKLAVK